MCVEKSAHNRRGCLFFQGQFVRFNHCNYFKGEDNDITSIIVKEEMGRLSNVPLSEFYNIIDTINKDNKRNETLTYYTNNFNDRIIIELDEKRFSFDTIEDLKRSTSEFFREFYTFIKCYEELNRFIRKEISSHTILYKGELKDKDELKYSHDIEVMTGIVYRIFRSHNCEIAICPSFGRFIEDYAPLNTEEFNLNFYDTVLKVRSVRYE